MKNNYDDLDEALNVESSIVEVDKTPTSLDVAPPKSASKPEDIKKDYDDDVRITAGGLDVVGVATFSTNVNVTGTLDAGLIDGGTY